MKKVIISAAIAASLIAGSATGAFAATSAPKPTVKAPAGGAEGTAKHEMSETSGTQKAESTKTVKTKKVAKKAKK